MQTLEPVFPDLNVKQSENLIFKFFFLIKYFKNYEKMFKISFYSKLASTLNSSVNISFVVRRKELNSFDT